MSIADLDCIILDPSPRSDLFSVLRRAEERPDPDLVRRLCSSCREGSKGARLLVSVSQEERSGADQKCGPTQIYAQQKTKRRLCSVLVRFVWILEGLISSLVYSPERERERERAGVEVEIDW